MIMNVLIIKLDIVWKLDFSFRFLGVGNNGMIIVCVCGIKLSLKKILKLESKLYIFFLKYFWYILSKLYIILIN